MIESVKIESSFKIPIFKFKAELLPLEINKEGDLNTSIVRGLCISFKSHFILLCSIKNHCLLLGVLP